MKLLSRNNYSVIENTRTILFAFSLLAIIVIIGEIGYMFIEDFTFVEAFFMTIITISTVGFEEVHPLSQAGQVFTAFLIIFSFGIFAFVVTTITRYVVDGIFRNYYKDNKVKKRIAKLENHVIVCGYGRNGKQAAIELQEHNEQVVIIEENESVVQKIREESDFLYINGDSTQDEVLQFAMISKAKALITTLPNDADNLFVVLTAREMNPGLKIISRASNDNSDIKLKRAGATNIIMPDKIGGQRMATLVAQPDVVEFLEYIMLQGSNDVNLEEISCENLSYCFAGKSIMELDVRNESGANIIGLK
ncbi:MAG: potassium channel family protein, partial [Bacteroidota bacterium]|nr:potassium channel family protein [Bacteroidota bacterium]